MVLLGVGVAQAAEPEAVIVAEANEADIGDETVLVTGQRGEPVPLQDEAVSASVISEKDARLRASSSRADLLRKVPGLMVMDLGTRANNIIIRGTATSPDGDPNGSSSATYFGDIPLSGIRGAALVDDLATYDMDRTEVLRGPQGTSYGAGALSGVLRNVPNSAELNVLEGSLSSSAKWTDGGSKFGYDIDGHVNVPLVDDMLALRVVGYGYRDDNPITSLLDGRSASDLKTWGARATLHFEPTDDLAMDLHYAHQDSDQPDLSRMDIGADFGSSEYRQPESSKFDLVYGRARWDLGFATATWAGSYAKGDNDYRYEYGVWYADVDNASSLASLSQVENEAVTQELSFSSIDRKGFDWNVGAYYDHRTSVSRSMFIRSDTSAPAFTEWDLDGVDDPEMPNLAGSLFDTKEEQIAGYGEVSYWFENGIGITAGLRYTHYSATEGYSDIIQNEPEMPPAMLESFPEEGVWWPKINVTWQRNDDELYYVQYAEASRQGGQNFGFLDETCSVDLQERWTETYEGDKIRTFEAGAKLHDRATGIAVNSSFYYSRWSNAPTYNAVVCGGLDKSYIDNVGEVELYGFEIEAFAPLAEGLTADVTVAYGVAQVAEDDPTYAGAVKGDKMPGNPEWKFSASFDYEREIGGGLELFAGAGVTYTGEYNNALIGDWSYYAPFATFPGLDVRPVGVLPGGLTRYSDPGSGDYALVDAKIGVQADDWSVTLFADNLFNTDKRVAISYLNTTTDGIATLTRVTPRMIGVRLSTEF